MAEPATMAVLSEDCADRPGALILVVASEWLSRHGGLSTFNRGLCAALAASGQRVVCLVPTVDVEESADATSQGVRLLAATPEPYAEDAVRLRRRPHLDDSELQVIIGHGRVTGPQARALHDDFFPAAARVHVIHTYAGHIEWFKQPGPNETRTKKAADREEHERLLAEDADVVAAVGPLLTRESQGLLGRDVVELIPGVGDLACKLPRALPPTRRCLLAGRAEDKELKGLDIAATAFGLLPRAEPREQPQLIIQGAPLPGADTLAQELAAMAGSRLKVHVAPYTEQPRQLALEMERASIAIMPSRREGFGLSGLEAISAGIPVLVSANSGLGELLSELGGAAAKCVVAVDDDLAVDSDRWAKGIAAALGDRQAAFERAAEVYRQVSARCVWENAATNLLTELNSHLSETSPSRGPVASAESGLPKAFSLPARNASFTGHSELLSMLDSAVEAGRAVQVITGPPGVGKTQVAVELAWRRRALYDVVWTVSAASAAAISADLAALASQLGISDIDSATEELVDAAQHWLVDHDDWLLLIDGLENRQLIETWLPLEPRGVVLITTREQSWGPVDETLVPPWTREESVAFLLARTGDPSPHLADDLAAALDDLPLALSMAAAYMDERGTGMESYLKQLQTRAPELLDTQAWRSRETAVDATVQAVWEELSKEPLALDLLNLAAFYAADRIPRTLLTTFLGLSESDRVEGDLNVDDRAIAAGMRFAMLVPQDDGFVLHPLLADRTRRELGEQAGVWAAQACGVVLSALSASPAAPMEFVPHALSATHYAMELNPEKDITGSTPASIVRLQILAARLLRDSGQHESATAALMEVWEFLFTGGAEIDDSDPILGIALALELADAEAASGNQDRSDSLVTQALSLAQSTGAMPTAEHRLSCEMLLDLLPTDPTSDSSRPWYEALSFRALETSRQVLSETAAEAQSSTNMALLLRIRILRYLVASSQFDDAAAVGIHSIQAVANTTNELTRTITELTVIALKRTGELVAADDVRSRMG